MPEDHTLVMDVTCPGCGTPAQAKIFKDQNGDWQIIWSWAQDTSTATATPVRAEALVTPQD